MLFCLWGFANLISKNLRPLKRYTCEVLGSELCLTFLKFTVVDPSGLFRIRDFPYLKFGISNFKAKSGRDSGLKVYAGDEMPKITVGITGSMAS